MLKRTDNNYRLKGIGSVSSVRTNAGSGSNAVSVLACRLATLGVKGSKWLLTMQESPKSVGIGSDLSVVLNDTDARMTGIVQIPPSTFKCSIQKTCPAQFAAHQDGVGAKEHCKRCRIINCISTFNPFVVGSTPARPTRFILAKATETLRWLLFLCPSKVPTRAVLFFNFPYLGLNVV
jgi:hypothetical protein